MKTSSLSAPAVDALPEQERNALLRRADWRFLLPEPRPARAACLAGGSLGRPLRLVAGEVLADGALLPGLDLAVASDPDGAALHRAWMFLRPGGALYVEILAGGARRVRRRLAAAGFRKIALYWPWPRAARARLWLPLERPEARSHLLAFPHLLGKIVPPAGLVPRVAAAALERAGAAHLCLGPRFPLCAVALRPGGPAAAEPLPTPLLLCGGPRSTSKVVALSFAPGEPRPRLAVKISRTPEAAATLAREAEVLGLLGQREVPPGIPRLVSVRETSGSFEVAETPVVGRPLYRLLDAGSYRELALRGTAWLADLAGCARPQPRERWWGRLAEPVLAGFERTFGAVANGEGLRRTRRALERLGSLPLVCEHRDFGPWNLMVSEKEGLGVLDWEGAEPEGLPGLDLLYFHAYLSFFLDGAVRTGRHRESYRKLFDPGTLQGAVLREGLALYAARTGVPGSTLDALRLLVWPLHARSEHRRLTADAAGPPDPAALRGSLFLGLWKEELRRHASWQEGG